VLTIPIGSLTWSHNGIMLKGVRIIAFSSLRRFWEQGHATAKGPLKAWFVEVCRASWVSMVDIKNAYPYASIIDSERVVFNIHGNTFRLVVKVWFAGQIVWVKFISTHAEYDKIDVKEL
jgi:mRNA interferase HigB